jgi:hypothetical protein
VQGIKVPVGSRGIQRGHVVSTIRRLSEAFGGGSVTSSTTILELLELFDADDVGSLRYLCNDWFNVNTPQARWKAATSPVGARNLGDIAELLSAVATVPIIRTPDPHGDREILARNVFLALRQAMVDRGAAEKRIKPATPLAKYVVSYSLVTEVIKIAGAASPDMKVECTRNRKVTGMIRAIAIAMSCGGLSLLIAITFFGGLEPRGTSVCAALGINLLSLALAAWVERAKRRVRIAGYGTFMELSAATAHRIALLSGGELWDVPGLAVMPSTEQHLG